MQAILPFALQVQPLEPEEELDEELLLELDELLLELDELLLELDELLLDVVDELPLLDEELLLELGAKTHPAILC